MSDLIFFSPTTAIAQPEATTQYAVVYPAWTPENVSGTAPKYAAHVIYINPSQPTTPKNLGYFDSEEAARAACDVDWEGRKKK